MTAESDASAYFEPEDAAALYGSFVIVRSVLLSGAVVLLGGFLLLLNVFRFGPAAGSVAVRVVGIGAALACLLILVLPAAVPAVILLVIVWGLQTSGAFVS